MENFDRDFDELLKNALNSDDDLEGLTMDENLIASTLSAIEEAAPHSEEIRASFDEGFSLSAEEETEPVETVQSAGKAESAPVEDDVVSLRQAGGRKKSFFTGKNIGMICGAVAGLAAVVLAVVFVNSTSFKKSESMATSDASATSFETATTATMTETKSEEAAMSREAADSLEFKMETLDSEAPALTENSVPMADAPAATESAASDEEYFFDDDDYYTDEQSDSKLLNNIVTLNDKSYYKGILEAVKSVAVGDPVVTDPQSIEDEMAAVAASGSVPDEITDYEEDEEDASEEEEFDINDPKQLAQALKESNQMLAETGGLPSDAAGEVIGSVEVDGEYVPDFDASPEKSPYWAEIGDASDEAFAEVAPLIVIYDKDDEADLDICVQVFDNRCVIYDFGFETTTTYLVSDGNALAETLRGLIPEE